MQSSRVLFFLLVAAVAAVLPAVSLAAAPLPLRADSHDSAVPAVSISVGWNQSLRTVNPMSYGVDCPACFVPAWTHSPALLKPLSAVTNGGKPLIRLHGWGMVTQGSPECWLNPDNTWNAAKIANALEPLIHTGYRLMIDIPSGPDGEKDPLHPAEMADMAASLVKIVNIENHFGVKYWELPNEREHILNATQMAAMFMRAEAAMKQVDPSILVGGPATDDINVPYISDFVRQVFPHVDFVSAHTYGGDGTQSDAASYNKAVEAVSKVAALRASLNAITQRHHLPIFVDEYNIGWDPTPNITNNQGAVYFSILQSGVIEAGGDVSDVWDFSPPHNMSIVTENGKLYPSANLFTLMNRYFYGTEVAATSTAPASVRAYAVRSASAHSLLLSNLSDRPLQIVLRFQGWKPDELHVWQISAAGYQDDGLLPVRQLLKNGMLLPASSVSVLMR